MKQFAATALSFACLSGIASGQVVMFENLDRQFAWYLASEYNSLPGNDLDITQGAGQAITNQGDAGRSVHWNFRPRSASNDYEYFGFSSRVARGPSITWQSQYTSSGDLIFAGLAPLALGDMVGPANDFGPPPDAEFDYIVRDITSGLDEADFRHIEFLGVQIEIDGNTHYGWIQLGPITHGYSPFQPAFGDSWTQIMSPLRWAYEMQPDTPIEVVPAPGTIAAMGLIGLAALRRRR